MLHWLPKTVDADYLYKNLSHQCMPGNLSISLTSIHTFLHTRYDKVQQIAKFGTAPVFPNLSSRWLTTIFKYSCSIYFPLHCLGIKLQCLFWSIIHYHNKQELELYTTKYLAWQLYWKYIMNSTTKKQSYNPTRPICPYM